MSLKQPDDFMNDENFGKILDRLNDKFIDKIMEIIDEYCYSSEEDCDDDSCDDINDILQKIKLLILKHIEVKIKICNRKIENVIEEHDTILEEVYKDDVQKIFNFINEKAEDL